MIFHNGEPVWECSEIYVPEQGHERDTSNNIAEYAAFIALLEWFADQNLYDADILIRGDSQLVINQMFGNWKIKKGLYVPMAVNAQKLIARFGNIRGEWIRRDQNAIADRLSKDARLEPTSETGDRIGPTARFIGTPGVRFSGLAGA